MPKQKPTTLLTISLPRAMAEQVERIRKAEQRGRSELVREALRTYFALARNFPEEKATPAEIKAISRAPAPEREHLRGTLHQMAENPLTGDIVRLHGEHPTAWRRRVGAYRIF